MLKFVIAPRSLLVIQLTLEQTAISEIDEGKDATFFSATTKFRIILT